VSIVPQFRWNDELSRFRVIAFFEGISFLALAITMPLKYGLDILWPNKVVGMAHGILFVFYVLLLVQVHFAEKWSFKKTIFCFFLSFVPAGTFYGELKVFGNPRVLK